MAGTTSSNQGAREVYGAIAVSTPLGDSAMDETNDAVRVNIVAGASAGGTSATDDAAFTPGVGIGTPIMGFADETGPDSVDEGDVGVVRMTLARALHVNLRDASGAEVSAVTQYDEDTASSAGDKLTMAGVVRKDTAATLVGTDGDRTQMQVDANGLLYVNASGAAVPVTDNGGSLTVDGTVTVTDGAGSLTVDGTVTVQDGGGSVSVDDNGGSLTVDGTVAATQSGAWTVTVQDGGNVISVDDGAGSLTVDGTVAVSGLTGSTTASAPTTATIGTSSATVIASNASRKGLALTNTSTSGQRISLHMANGSAVLDSGRTLWPGDIFEMDPWSFTTAQINGIASAAGATIGIQEMT